MTSQEKGERINGKAKEILGVMYSNFVEEQQKRVSQGDLEGLEEVQWAWAVAARVLVSIVPGTFSSSQEAVLAIESCASEMATGLRCSS